MILPLESGLLGRDVDYSAAVGAAAAGFLGWTITVAAAGPDFSGGSGCGASSSRNRRRLKQCGELRNVVIVRRAGTAVSAVSGGRRHCPALVIVRRAGTDDDSLY